MKKISKILITTIICLLLTGCSFLDGSNKDINAKRGKDYMIDFANFIEIKECGSEGAGFLEIAPKSFSLSDFNNEEVYIRVKKIMDSLDLKVNSDTKSTSAYLMVTPNENLKNGDIVTIGIREGWTNPDSQITVNIEPYLYQVRDLKEGEVLDLFSETSVLFYGLDGSNDVYAYKKSNGNIPKEILDKLIYKIKVDDDELEADKTVLSIEVSMDEKELSEGDNPAYTMNTYLGRMGYVTESSKEKVLTKIITPINNDTIDKEKLMNVIMKFLNSGDIIVSNNLYTLESINTVQQNVSSNNTKNQFTYLVTFYVSRAGERQCMSTKLKIVEIEGEYIVAEKTEALSKTNDNYCTLAAEGYVIVADYNIVDEEQEVEDAETKETKSVTIEEDDFD